MKRRKNHGIDHIVVPPLSVGLCEPIFSKWVEDFICTLPRTSPARRLKGAKRQDLLRRLEVGVRSDVNHEGVVNISQLQSRAERIAVRLGESKPEPSANAKFLLYLFLEKRGREEAVGDALEEYSGYVKRVGKLRADILFYQEVGRCAWPFIRRMVAKIGGLVVIGEWLRKLTH